MVLHHPGFGLAVIGKSGCVICELGAHHRFELLLFTPNIKVIKHVYYVYDGQFRYSNGLRKKSLPILKKKKDQGRRKADLL